MFIVYVIRNSNNDIAYYGSTQEFSKRKKRHLRDLNNNTHHNVLLQRDWTAQAGKGFVFKIVKRCATRLEAYSVELTKILASTTNGKTYNILIGGHGGDAYTRHPDYEKLLVKKQAAMQRYFSNLSEQERKARYGRKGRENGNWKGGPKLCACGEPIAATATSCLVCRDRTGKANPFYGKSHSAKTKRLLSEANKGKLPPNTRQVKIGKTKYESAASAARALDVVPATILHRIKSPNPKYAGYRYLD